MHDRQRQKMLEFHPAHRNTDPGTSKLAEDSITISGARLTQALKVLGLVKRHTGFTSAELAKISTLDRHMVARRLPDLEHAGYIEKGDTRQCGISHLQAVTWWFIREPDLPTSAGGNITD